MSDTDPQLSDLLRRTLRAKAEQTPAVVGRRRSHSPQKARGVPLIAAAVVGIGVLGTVLVNTRDRPDAASDPTATPASAPDPSTTDAREIVSPPQDAPGLSVSPAPPGPLTPSSGSGSGVVVSPTGTLAVLQNDLGSFPPPPAPTESREVAGNDVTTWNEVGGIRVYSFTSGCSSIQLAAITSDEPWMGDMQTVLEQITVLANGAIALDLPSSWASYGGGRPGPRYQYEFTMTADGSPVTFQVTQTFDSDIGATVRTLDAEPTTINDAPALIYTNGALSTVVFEFDGDVVGLSASIDQETLSEVAASLGHHGMETSADVSIQRDDTSASPRCDTSVTIATP